jgi:predicted nucleic acid-binding protein
VACFDSAFLIDALKEREPARDLLADLHDRGEPLTITPVAATEVLRGASPRGGRTLDMAVEFLRGFSMLEFDLKAALATARIGAELQASGRPLSFGDTLIAGIVVRHGERLVTRDGDFARVRGLRIERY